MPFSALYVFLARQTVADYKLFWEFKIEKEKEARIETFSFFFSNRVSFFIETSVSVDQNGGAVDLRITVAVGEA